MSGSDHHSWTLSFLISAPDQPRTRTFKSLSRGDMLEIVTLQAFPIPFEPSLGHVYDVEVPIPKKSMLEMVTSGAMFDHM